MKIFEKKLNITIKSITALLALSSSLTLMSIEKDRLIYGETTRLSTFDPYTTHEASGQRLTDLLFNSLVKIDPGGNYQAELASSWKIENSGTSVIFNLRKDVYWHPKESNSKRKELSANDIVATIKILKATSSNIPNKERFQFIADTKVISKYKVRVKLTQAMVDPLKNFTFKIMPSHILNSDTPLNRDHSFVKNPIGTGPYIFKANNGQGEVLLVANPDYFKGRPKIAKIIMKPYADENVMAQSLMFNSLDLITYVSPRDLNEIIGDRKLGVIPYDALSFSFFAFNTSKGVLRDKRVRQAISHAINRKEMLNAFFMGKGTLISGPFPPTSWAYNLDVKPMKFDINKAKVLLQKAGMRWNQNEPGAFLDHTGKPIKLLFAVPLSGESEMIKRIALAFQNYLVDVGIQVDLQFMDWLIWKKRVLRDHNYDITIASWSFDDASNITSLFHSSSAQSWGNNFVMYRNQQVDAMLTEANVTNDFDKRRAIYQKLHLILADEAPYTYLWTLQHHAAHNTRLKGVQIEPFSFFRNIALWNIK